MIDPHTACGYYLLEQMPRDPLTRACCSPPPAPTSSARGERGSGLRRHGTDFECMDVLARETGTTAGRPASPRDRRRALQDVSGHRRHGGLRGEGRPGAVMVGLTALTDNSQNRYMLYQHVSVFCFLMSRVGRYGMFKHVRALSRAAFLRLFTCNRPNGVLLVFLGRRDRHAAGERENPCGLLGSVSATE